MASPKQTVKRKIISLEVDAIRYNDAVEQIICLAKSRQPGYVCFANVHMTIEAYQDSYFADQVNNASFVLPDGVPIVKSLRLLYGHRQERIAGMDVMPSLIREAASNSLNLFFFGTTTHVLAKIKERTQQLYPNAKIVGLYSPPFNESWNDDLYVDLIRRSNAHLVFVALGCPKQEKWIAMNSQKINAVLLGVGAAFPVYAGLQERAPLWLRNLSLEWVHRMMQEPGRLIKRYATTNALFIQLFFKVYFAKLLRHNRKILKCNPKNPR